MGHDQCPLVRAGRGRAAVLTVLNVAYPLAPVGPDAVGGAEQVLSAIDQALTEAGHRSIVVACEGLRCCRGTIDRAASARWRD